jgi:predicted MFS family arabinose efflux permease
VNTADDVRRDVPGQQIIAARTWSDHYTSIVILASSFLPFAAGYFISYLFRTVNATIAGRLISDLKLDAQHLGLLTSAYFLTFALVQIPLGIAIDRYGPRRVQVALLFLAVLGAVLFANAAQFWELMLGRALIGAGVSASLIAGLKSIRQSLPRERQPLANGIFVAIGTAGAVFATLPVDALLNLVSWRELFLLLAAATALVAILIAYVAPEENRPTASKPDALLQLRNIYLDRRFWRLAPLSATCIGTAWGLHGLWAGPWLTDVASLDHQAVVRHLFLMGTALCASALFLGMLSDALRRFNVSNETILGVAATVFIVAQMCLVIRPNVSLALLWSIIAGMGASTVLSYAILAQYFPKEIAGQANAALNLLHIGGAFVIQSSIGMIVGTWPHDEEGHYPPSAYAAAFVFLVLLQAGSLVWFVWAGRRREDAPRG